MINDGTISFGQLKSLQSEFDSFCKACFGAMGTQQYNDLRRTFMGGAAALLDIQMNSLSAGDETTESDLTMMKSIQAELREFSAAVKRGEK